MTTKTILMTNTGSSMNDEIAAWEDKGWSVVDMSLGQSSSAHGTVSSRALITFKQTRIEE